jgi:probable selenium-dependent hydroxylase accessory protein YqeC
MAYLQEIVNRLGRKGDSRLRQVVVTRLASRPDLLLGVSPDFAATIDRECFPLVLNEADGARSMSLKMPREGEPVLMKSSNYLVPVIGLDCLNKPLGPQTLFRWQIASERHSLEAGQIITPELAASILLHPLGVCKDWRAGTHIIPYINKADTEELEPSADELAQALLHNTNYPVERVVWGSLHNARVNSATTRIQ